MSNVTGMLITPGSPCLRKFADGTRICEGTMEKDESVLLNNYLAREVGELTRPLTAAERQALNRLDRKNRGICRQCSNRLAKNSIVFCEDHLKQHRERAKQSYVSKSN
jgi:hypothetical protein